MNSLFVLLAEEFAALLVYIPVLLLTLD